MNILGYNIIQTCSACPEQYDVVRHGQQVGYLRLRHGCFTAEVPDCGGEQVFLAHPKGDGIFESEERMSYLQQAVAAIAAKVSA